jgi:uncharacterized protein YbjQ (UPF0145 family)
MGKSITDLCSVTTVGLDLAKHVFQGHGVDASGRVGSRLGKEQRASHSQLDAAADAMESSAPCRPSSAAIGALTDWAKLSTSAARVTCWRSATATKTRSCSSVIGSTLSGYRRRLYEGRLKALRNRPPPRIIAPGFPLRAVVGACHDRRRRRHSISEAGLRHSRESLGRPPRRLAPCTYSASSRPRPARRLGVGEAASEPCRRNGR